MPRDRKKLTVLDIPPEPRKYRITVQMDVDVEQTGEDNEQDALHRIVRDSHLELSSFGRNGHTIIKLDKTSIRQVKDVTCS